MTDYADTLGAMLELPDDADAVDLRRRLLACNFLQSSSLQAVDVALGGSHSNILSAGLSSCHPTCRAMAYSMAVTAALSAVNMPGAADALELLLNNITDDTKNRNSLLASVWDIIHAWPELANTALSTLVATYECIDESNQTCRVQLPVSYWLQ